MPFRTVPNGRAFVDSQAATAKGMVVRSAFGPCIRGNEDLSNRLPTSLLLTWLSFLSENYISQLHLRLKEKATGGEGHPSKFSSSP